MTYQLPYEFWAHFQSNAEVIAQIPRPTRGERNIDGNHEGFVTRAIGTTDDIVSDVIEARDIELKPGILRSKTNVVFDRSGARGRQRAGNAGFHCGLRNRLLAAGAHQIAKADRRGPEGERPTTPKQGRREVALLDIDEHA